MKIAVTATGKSLDSKVDQRFGRAAFFIVANTDTMDFEVIENENIAAAGGAGINSAKTVIDAGAEAVLTGNCGPNAGRTLSAAGVKLFTGITGTVGPVIELFKKGELTEASGPSVREHFGMGAGKQSSAEPDK
jgi:predicted Fe-Mo cluster-binding NifX family protein